MSTKPADFTDLPDLASEDVGGAAIACNDEFFAEKENLLKAAAAVWKDHVYTDRGKWMDGWETRRYRPADSVAPGPNSDVHDWCVVRLGLPGRIRGIVVDTAWFRGNYPDSCAIEACELDDALDLRALEGATWHEVLPRSPLQGDTRNSFPIASPRRVTHLRLRIYPDGGVARLRVHGDVVPRWSRLRALGGVVDLAALENGAVVESCSDMFFGSRTNLIKPGPSRSMADGWETRRRRGPGHDWARIELAAAGTVERLELDTSHFKGNAPARAEVAGAFAPDGVMDAGTVWRTLLATPMQPHTRHVFDAELRRIGPVTHLMLSVFPCGGIARLRAWGQLSPVATPAAVGVAKLNAMTADEATAALRRCNGCVRWADEVARGRPFEDEAALLRISERTWWALEPDDHLQAFAAHPKIGESRPHDAATAAWSTAEQRTAAESTADAARIRDELAAANARYAEQFGFIFIVCATGRTAAAMLADLRARMPNTRADEMRTAAEEQAKITRLRIHKLLAELGA